MTLAQQQRLDQLAAGLLLGGTILATSVNYFTKQGFWSPNLKHSALIALIVFQPFYLVQLYYISKGKRWAKLCYLVLEGLGLIGWALSYKRVAAIEFTSPVATMNILFEVV